MLRRFIVMVSVATAGLVVASAFDAVAAEPGLFRWRNKSSGQPATRTYRSYSVSPGAESVREGKLAAEGGVAVPDGAGISGNGAISNPPARATTRTPSKSKPSYLRADSKALGRFGQ